MPKLQTNLDPLLEHAVDEGMDAMRKALVQAIQQMRKDGSSDEEIGRLLIVTFEGPRS